jgi:hypothetical protein
MNKNELKLIISESKYFSILLFIITVICLVLLFIYIFLNHQKQQIVESKGELKKLELFEKKREDLLQILSKTIPFTMQGDSVFFQDEYSKQMKLIRENNKNHSTIFEGLRLLKLYPVENTKNNHNHFAWIAWRYTKTLTDEYKNYLNQQDSLKENAYKISEVDNDIKEIKSIIITAIEQQIAHTNCGQFHVYIDEKYESSLSTEIKNLIKLKLDKLK